MGGSLLKRLYPGSLTARLRLASCLLLPLIMGITALVLEQAFSNSLEAATRERLRLQTYVLLGAAEAGGGTLWMPPVLQEPRFSQPGSGLYGLVAAANGRLLWRSQSTLGLELERVPDQPGQSFGRLSSGLFYYRYPVVWETEDGHETPFTFVTLESPAAFKAELSTFRLHLWGGLGLLAALLLLAQHAILRWGLNPLGAMARDLKAIEQGTAKQLGGDYPAEVAPVTANLNLLLEAEQRQRERYRHTLADLAHSLKTPLAVLRNQAEAGTAPDPALLNEQVDRMDQIISHQLGRASTSDAHRLLQPVSVRQAVERIGKALQKVYRDKFRDFEIDGGDALFKGDERDLMEMLGNLIDNGFKYGDGRLKVVIATEAEALRIAVEDNGPGIDAALYERIQQRGSRADAVQPGQGIGLAVVRDILSGYGGRLEVSGSALGGACFTLVLPG